MTRKIAHPAILVAILAAAAVTACGGTAPQAEPPASPAVPATPPPSAKPQVRESADEEANALLLQAREKARDRSRAGTAAAIDLYEKAIARDPAFVRAYAELAVTCGQLDPATDPLVRRPRAKAAAERAVARDGASGPARAALGFVRYRFEWRWADAQAEFARAIAAEPDDAFVRHQHGLFLHAIGQAADALVELERALALEPESPAIRADMVAPLLRAGRTADARAAVDRLSAITPPWPAVHQLASAVLAAEGRMDDSVEQSLQALRAQGTSVRRVDELRSAYAAGGLAAMTERRIRQLTAELEDGPSPPSSYRLATELALAHASLKRRDRTLHWLAVAIDLHEDAPLYMRSSAAFDFVRDAPEFNELLRRAKLDAVSARRD